MHCAPFTNYLSSVKVSLPLLVSTYSLYISSWVYNFILQTSKKKNYLIFSPLFLLLLNIMLNSKCYIVVILAFILFEESYAKGGKGGKLRYVWHIRHTYLLRLFQRRTSTNKKSQEFRQFIQLKVELDHHKS